MTAEAKQRIRLLDMPGDPDPLPVGATGTITKRTPLGQVWVDWDPPNERRSLMLVEGVDRWEVIPTRLETLNGNGELWLDRWGFYGACNVSNCTFVTEQMPDADRVRSEVRQHLGLIDDPVRWEVVTDPIPEPPNPFGTWTIQVPFTEAQPWQAYRTCGAEGPARWVLDRLPAYLLPARIVGPAGTVIAEREAT
jgi:hypothetical protein